MPSLTHRDCFARVMSGQATDWVPNYELGCWQQTVQRWSDEGLPRQQSNIGDMDMFEGEPLFSLDRRAFARLNINMIPHFDEQILAEDEQTITVRHANGVTTQALKAGTVRGTRMSMDAYLDFPVKDRADWQELKKRYDPLAPARYPFWWDQTVRTWRDRDYPVCLLGNGTFGLYSQLRSWVGTENISIMFFDDPSLVEEMVEYNTEFLLALIDRAVTDVDFDYFNFFEDCAGKGGPLYGPDQFNRFFRKPYTRIIERLNRAGIQSIWLDSDGQTDVLIPLWMDVGINCHWPLEQASDMDPLRLRRKFGNGLALLGGIDKMAIARGRDAIEKELTTKIPPLLESGGYIPHIDHSIPPDISYDDFMYYMDLKRKLIGQG